MATLARHLSSAALLILFLGGGLLAGPSVRSAYERLFPEPAFVTGDFAALYREAGTPIVMFSTSTCPFCRRARELLDHEQAQYRDFVVDQSPDAQRQFEALGGGGVPLLFIGNRRIVGFRADTIRESLSSIPSPSQTNCIPRDRVGRSAAGKHASLSRATKSRLEI